MTTTAADHAADTNIVHPEYYSRHGYPHDIWERMRAEDLMSAVFPAQLACQDPRQGPIEVPDHPLVNETIDNCLHEAMDAEGLGRLLERIEKGAIRTLSVETPAPSPMSHEILNANPYAFLDNAPLEERRARAVATRRTFSPEDYDNLGQLSPGRKTSLQSG